MQARRFTLVELMAVMVVLAIVIGMTTPVFEKIMMGTNVEAGTRLLSSQLRMARQYAISKRKRVALLILAKNFDIDANIAPDSGDTFLGYRASALRPCIVDASNNFESYIEGSKWSFLPDGVYIDTFSPNPGLEIDNVDFPQTGGSYVVNNVRCLVFKPSGSLTTTTNPGIRVAKMILSGQTLVQQNVNANSLTLTVNWLTGRVK